jgi:laminin alpha 1/2
MFEVGTMLELELEFRTAELNGVLLSVSEPPGYPALSLELLDGQVSGKINVFTGL